MNACQSFHALVILPVIGKMIKREQNIHPGTILCDLILEHGNFLHRVHRAPDFPGLALIKRSKEYHQKCHIIGECHSPPKSVFLIQGPAKTAVICLVLIKFFYFQLRFIHRHISKHMI